MRRRTPRALARSIRALLALALLALAPSCAMPPSLLLPTSTPTATPTATPTPAPSPTPTQAPTPTATPTPVPLTLSIYLEPATVPQGHMATLLIQPNRRATLTATVQGRPLPLFQEGEHWYGFIGVWAATAVGTWTVAIITTDPLGGPTITEHREVRITARDFPIDRITLEPAVLSLLDPQFTVKEAELVRDLIAPHTPKRLWQEPFLRPLDGRITSTYGERRSYNHGPATGYHSGLDLAAPEGHPVVATNTGRVVFAGPLTVRGTTVIIDHGWGLYSGYYHLSEIEVAADQSVQRGQTIGLVGSTGVSTGPHLHWQFWQSGAAIDPVFVEGWQLPTP